MPNTTITVRPNDTIEQGSWVRTGGSFAHGVLSDDSDATYMAATPPVSEAVKMYLEYGNPAALPAGAKIVGVQPRFRQAHDPSDPDVSFAHHWRLEASGILSNVLVATSSSGVPAITQTKQLQSVRPDGAAWLEADFATLRTLHFAPTVGGAGGGKGRIYELYLNIIYNQRPVATVTVPAESAVVTTSRPTVQGTFSDPEGDAQTAFRFKVFTLAQYSIGGFNSETSPFTADSGKIASASAPSWLTDVDLLDGGTYRAYLWVYQDNVNGVEHKSAADFNTFSVDLVPPPVPSVASTYESPDNRVKVDITRGTPDVPTAEYFIVDRSDDDGVTYETILDGKTVLVTGSTTTIYDYLAPPRDDIRYRARAVDTGIGQPVISLPSAYSLVDVPTRGWQLKDPEDSSRNQIDLMEIEVLDQDSPEQHAVFNPLGRGDAVLVSDSVIQGVRGSLTFVVSEVQEDDLQLLIRSQRTLLLVAPWGEQWFVRVYTRNRRVDFGFYRHVSFVYVEVESPA